MAKKTLYVREADLPIWDAVEKMIGEKSMSQLVTEALREKLGRVDGFLNVIRSSPGLPLPQSPFAVMFAPVDGPGGAMKPHYCSDLEDLKTFLANLGLTAPATDNIVAELNREYHSNIRLSLTQDKIALI